MIYPQRISRRALTVHGLAGSIFASFSSSAIANEQPSKLLFVHGRAQGGRDPGEIKKEWLEALTKGAEATGLSIPEWLSVELPFYGSVLDDFVKESNLPRVSEIRTKGDAAQDQFLQFQSEFARDLQEINGISDQQIDDEYGSNTREKGPLNWEWVQAMLRAIDNGSNGLSAFAIETFTRDVFHYLTRNYVRRAINRIVEDSLDDQPTIVVAHSLGSVVCYDVLRNMNKNYQIPHLFTVGSPLGISTIRRYLAPIKYPRPVTSWSNFYDERDVVALNPLDATNFSVDPAIANYGNVENMTSNRHGISGYLSDPNLAGDLLMEVSS